MKKVHLRNPDPSYNFEGSEFPLCYSVVREYRNNLILTSVRASVTCILCLRKMAGSHTLPDGTIEIRDAKGSVTTVIV